MGHRHQPPGQTASDTLLRIEGPEDFQRAFAVSHETLARLESYQELLVRWQRTQNLVSPRTLGDVWQRHFADSAQLLDLAPDGARIWWDLGSGAGFPGLVLAILMAGRAASPTPAGRRAVTGAPPGEGPPLVHLVESNGRKCAFLHEVARQTGVTVEIHHRRIESPPDSAKVTAVDIITARALAPLERLLGLAAPYFSPRTRAFFLKGREASREVDAARRFWRFTWNTISSRTDPRGSVVEVRDLHPV
jgi:16S rRNA (guanine527-N7)-methyltransferase